MEDELFAALMAARELKESVVARSGRTDVLPLLDLWGVSTSFIAPLTPVPEEDRPAAVSAAIAAARPYLAIFVVDTFWLDTDALSALLPTYQHGDLARRHADGDPRVKEALMVLGCGGVQVEMRILPYVYEGPPWKVSWQTEQSCETQTADGRFVDAMLRGFDLVAANADPGAQLLALKKLGTNLMSREGVAYEGTPRNAPCPCGSNRKYKHCHGS